MAISSLRSSSAVSRTAPDRVVVMPVVDDTNPDLDVISQSCDTLGDDAISVLEEFPSAPASYDALLPYMDRLIAERGDDFFISIAHQLATEFEVEPSSLDGFLTELVFGEDSTEAILKRSDFSHIRRLLLLYLGCARLRVPGFYYGKQRAYDHVISEGETPFTGFNVFSKICVIRLDVKESVKARLARGPQMVKDTEEHYYGRILEVLKEFPEVHYVKTAGDEAGFFCEDYDVALDFSHAVQSRFVGESEFAVEIGIAKNGPAYFGIDSSGSSFVGGLAWRESGRVQKTRKKIERSSFRTGRHELAGSSGIFVFDCETRREWADDVKQENDTSLLSLDGSATLTRMVPASAADSQDAASSATSFSLPFSSNSPDLVSQFKQVIALLASTTPDPERVFDEQRLMYPRTTVLFVALKPPVLTLEDEQDPLGLHYEWEEAFRALQGTVEKYGGTVLYKSSEGHAIVLFGAFRSSPLYQERRAMACTAELLSHREVVRGIACTQDNHFAQGLMVGSVNGAGKGIDEAARLLECLKNAPAHARLVMEADLADRLSAQGDVTFLDQHEQTQDVRDFGELRLRFSNELTPSLQRFSTLLPYAELFEAVYKQTMDSLRASQPTGVASFCLEAKPGMGGDDFLQALVARFRSEAGVPVFTPSQRVQGHRAYALFHDIFVFLFPTPERFDEWLRATPGPHEVWRVLYREISSGHPSIVLFDNPAFVAEGLTDFFAAVTRNSPMVFVLPALNDVDTYSQQVVNALLKSPGGRLRLSFLAQEPLPVESATLASVSIPLQGASLEKALAMVAEELGVAPLSLDSSLIGFYESRLGHAAPWPPFLVLALTQYLLQKDLLRKGDPRFHLPDDSGVSTSAAPISFEDYTRSLYDKLSPSARDVFRHASLLGIEAPCFVLAHVSGLSEDAFSSALRELTEAGILNLQDGEHYCFCYDFMPEAASRILFGNDPQQAHADLLPGLAALGEGADPFAIPPQILMEQARRAGVPQQIAPAIVRMLDSIVRDLPLNTEMLAQRYLELVQSVTGSLSPEESVAVFRVWLRLFSAQAQLRRPYEEVIKGPLGKCKEGIQRFCRTSKSSLLAELGVLLEDIGDIYRLKDVSGEGIRSLISLGSEEGRLADYDTSLRWSIEFAKARYFYRHDALSPEGKVLLQKRRCAAEKQLSRLQFFLSDERNQISFYDRERLHALIYTLRDFLVIKLVSELRQGPPLRSLFPQEIEDMKNLIKDVADFLSHAKELSFRQTMDCVYILTGGNALIGDFGAAHAHLDPLLERAENDGQLGLKVRLVNLKVAAFGYEMESALTSCNVVLVKQLWEKVQPLKSFIEAHRSFLIGGDNTLIVFYRNLIGIHSFYWNSLLPNDPLRNSLYAESRRIFEECIPQECPHYQGRDKYYYDRASQDFASMNGVES